MNADPPGIALIGCGDIARSNHLPGIQASPFALRAICDSNRSRVEKFKQDLKLDPSVAVCATLEEVLALRGIDAVSIATPPASHAPLSIQALDAGKHVLCEKPSALSSEENRRICAAVERNPGRTVQFFSSRFRHGAAPDARRHVREGKLGKVCRADIQFWLPAARTCDRNGPAWFGQKAHAGGGPFMDMGQYFIDRLFYILDWPKWTRMTAHTFLGFPTGYPADVAYDVEDHMSLLAHFGNDLVLTVDTTARVNQHWRWHTTIVGTQGSLCLDNTAANPAVFRSLQKGAVSEEKLEIFEPGHDTKVRLDQLAAYMKGERPEIGTDHVQALAISEFCEAAYRSAEERKEIRAEDAA
jgi:predicted dehydrogenase